VSRPEPARALPDPAASWSYSALQRLQAGLLDEIVIHLAAVLLGDGVRLYDSVGTDPIVLTRTALAATGQLIDLRFRI
jgi:riboflavin biosynthesis pyrimidine reductase